MKIEYADSFFQRMRGLMFRRKHDHALVFKFERASRADACIHSFFVFFQFDAVFLDAAGRVVDVRTVKPCSFIVPKKPAAVLIELPAGFARKHGVRPGQKLDLETLFKA